ncbi:MAG: YtxH domain-containing protein [Sphingobacteriales bacterium]|nr:MAG: YtxH domain-containing protein [Sphingobacteriales bacterium]
MKTSRLLMLAAGGLAIAGLLIYTKQGKRLTSNISSSAGDLTNKLGDLTKNTRSSISDFTSKLSDRFAKNHSQEVVNS